MFQQCCSLCPDESLHFNVRVAFYYIFEESKNLSFQNEELVGPLFSAVTSMKEVLLLCLFKFHVYKRIVHYSSSPVMMQNEKRLTPPVCPTMTREQRGTNCNALNLVALCQKIRIQAQFLRPFVTSTILSLNNVD